MTRSELIIQLAERFPQLMQKDAEMAIAEIFRAIHAALAEGNRVEIRGFGSFNLSYRPPRQARNPKTGAPVAVAGKMDARLQGWQGATRAGQRNGSPNALKRHRSTTTPCRPN